MIQKILSCVARMRGRYGRARVVQVLMGSRAREIRDTHLTRLSTYGLLRGTSRPVIEAYLDALLEADCVQIVGAEFPKLDLTALGRAVMRRQQSIQLSLPGSAPSRTAVPAATAAQRPAIPSLTPEVVVPSRLPEASRREAASAPDAAYDATLLERLRTQRTALARAEAVPPYCVCNDRTLREMAMQLPTDRIGLLRIHGIGEAKAAKYGDMFLTVIRDYLAQ
jgi:ATP-dependent DNA helicase RecQ